MTNKTKKKSNIGERSFSSIRITMLITLVFGFALAVLLFLVINFAVRSYITTDYLSDEMRAERDEKYRNDLQRFINENGLDSDDINEIAKWAQEQKYLYVMIYKDDKLLFESGNYEEEKPEIGENKENDNDVPPENGNDGDGEGGTDGGSENGEGDNIDGGNGDGGVDNGNDGTADDDGGANETPGEDTEGEDGTDTGGGAADGKDDTPDDNENKDDDGTGDSTDDDEDRYPSQGITVKPPTREELVKDAIEKGTYPLYMSDDGILLASMVDYTEYLYYDICNIVSVIAAMTAFFIVMWVFFYGITRRITKLGREVRIVAEGDTAHPIPSFGDDEIARLCVNVENMRSTMLRNLEKERAALDANKDLITAMSHDIRTPLTVLLGYLDIMKLNATDDAMRSYITASEKTALRLKRMSDDMFGYFLVYGGGIDVTLAEYNAYTLLDQILTGHIMLLREQGYDISCSLESDECDIGSTKVNTDPALLMRIVENIFSNLLKYADKEKQIVVNIAQDPDELTINVCNFIAKNPDEAQSNGIGLKSCMKIASAMDVRFSFGEAGDKFESHLSIPTVDMTDYSALPDVEEGGGVREFFERLAASFRSFGKAAAARLSKIGRCIAWPFKKLYSLSCLLVKRIAAKFKRS